LCAIFKQYVDNRRALRIDSGEKLIDEMFDIEIVKKYSKYIPHSRLARKAMNSDQNSIVFVQAMGGFEVNKVVEFIFLNDTYSVLVGTRSACE
jgi:hypothetical protein